jgi:uncharacterized protein
MTQPSERSPRETVERFLAVAAHGTPDEMADLYAEDSVIEMPFGPQPGVPLRFEGREGPSGHRARFASFLPAVRVTGIDLVALHETADPEVVIVEYDYHAVAVPTGRSFTNRYIMVVRVRDGLIAYSRDYASPLGSAAAFGTLDRIVEAARGSA